MSFNKAILAFSLLPLSLAAGDRIAGRAFATRSEVIARNGAAATSHPLATVVALHVLAKGGSAVDAAIAANALQCVAEPMSCGLGGDLFAIVWAGRERKLYGLNASGRSPRALTRDVFRAQGLSSIPLRGPLSVSVPGCVDGWLIPGFVTKEGAPFMSFGVMGGDMQPQGHVQVLLNAIEFGMNLQEAGDAPRVRHLGSSSPRGDIMTDGGKVALESGIPEEVRRALAAKGHRLVPASGGFGGYQAILYDAANDAYRAASESRKDGMAAGY